jgi:predicted lipoprotein with Yx(FWY)xxD motif
MRRIALWCFCAAVALAVPAATAAPKAVVVKAVYNKALKSTILVDGRGMSLYIWTADNPKNHSVCTPDPNCAKFWPALKAPASAGPGIKASLLGVTDDGKHVSYAGHPLYYFAGAPGVGHADKKPGDLNGQGVYTVWWVITPKGTAVKQIP